MFEFTYTPIDKTGSLKTETTVNINGYDNVKKLIADYESGRPLFGTIRTETNGHDKDCVAKRMAISDAKKQVSYWNDFSALRRSNEWHALIRENTDNDKTFEKLVLDSNGANERGSISKKLRLDVELDDGYRENTDNDRNDATVKIDKKTNVATITWKVDVREYTPAERATSVKKATLEDYVAYVATVDGKPKSLDVWMSEQNDDESTDESTDE